MYNDRFAEHYGHSIVIEEYGKNTLPNPEYSLECLDCLEVIVHASDFD